MMTEMSTVEEWMRRWIETRG